MAEISLFSLSSVFCPRSLSLRLPPPSKLHRFSAHELEAQLPQLPTFARILRRLDPPGTFTNDYVSRLLLRDVSVS
jgi:hypothetical protein